MKLMLAGVLALAMFGCSSTKKATTIDVQETLDTIITTYFSEMASMPYEEMYVSEVFGLTEEEIVSFAGVTPMISAVATDVAVFEAQEGKVEDVKAAVESYKEFKKNNAWYPIETENAEKAVVYVNGNYVFFIMAENVEEVQAYVEGLFQ